MVYAAHSTEERAELIPDPDCTIENAHALHCALLDPKGLAGEVVVNMSEVRHIDVSCLQLLCSAHHAAVRQGRKVTLKNVKAETRDVMKILGFVRHVGCRDDSDGRCLWIDREDA